MNTAMAFGSLAAALKRGAWLTRPPRSRLCRPRLTLRTGEGSYLSAFRFGEDFRRLLVETDSTAGFAGECWSPWLWWDIDADELGYAHKDAGALAAFLVERYAVEPGDLLLFFSGSKGFHVGLPTALWSPAPSEVFHKVCRRFAERLAELATVTIDAGVYDKVRAFRAPNSRHPKTGLHKRRLTFDELLGPLAIIVGLAKTPAPFDVPAVTKTSEAAAADWQAAVDQVAREGEARAARRAAGNGAPTLNRSTLDFIREGAGTGDRHRLLYSAAANLAEFRCPPALAVALLEEAALDSGLAAERRSPANRVRACRRGSPRRSAPTQQDRAEPPQGTADGSTVKEPPDAAASEAGGLGGESSSNGRHRRRPPIYKRRWPGSGDRRRQHRSPTRAARPPPKPQSPAIDAAKPPTLPPDPPPLPLPPGAVGSGMLDKPCRCGSRSMWTSRSAKAGPAGTAASAGGSSALASGMTRGGRSMSEPRRTSTPPPTVSTAGKRRANRLAAGVLSDRLGGAGANRDGPEAGDADRRGTRGRQDGFHYASRGRRLAVDADASGAGVQRGNAGRGALGPAVCAAVGNRRRNDPIPALRRRTRRPARPGASRRWKPSLTGWPSSGRRSIWKTSPLRLTPSTLT